MDNKYKDCQSDNCKYYKEIYDCNTSDFTDYCLKKNKEIKHDEKCDSFEEFRFCDTCKHDCGAYYDDESIDITYRCDLQDNKLIYNQCSSILQLENCPIECPINKWEEFELKPHLKEEKETMKIEELKKDCLWSNHRIIPNKVYNIWTRENHIVAKILTFDGNKFVLDSVEGLRIIKREEIEEMGIAVTDDEGFNKKQENYLISIGFEK